MKYLVTGACGFTGSHIVDILVEQGSEVRATDLAGSDRQYLPAGVEFIPSDVTDIDSLRVAVQGIDIVLHPAAIFNFNAPVDLLHRVNVQGTENLCIAAREAGVKRLVSWSSSGVYGNQQCPNPPICEDFPIAPIENYSRSKVKQDAVVMKYNADGLPASIIRPGVVYGPRSKYGAAQIFEGLSILPIVPLPSNFEFRMGTVHVRDIAGASIFISTKDEAVGEVYGCVDSSNVTMTDFMTMVAEEHGAKVIPIPIPPMLARYGGLLAGDICEFLSKYVTKKPPLVARDPILYFPVDLCISNRKLRDLGYNFEFDDIREGVRQTIAWMRDQGQIGISTMRQYI